MRNLVGSGGETASAACCNSASASSSVILNAGLGSASPLITSRVDAVILSSMRSRLYFSIVRS